MIRSAAHLCERRDAATGGGRAGVDEQRNGRTDADGRTRTGNEQRELASPLAVGGRREGR